MRSDEIEPHDNTINSTALGHDQHLWLQLVETFILFTGSVYVDKDTFPGSMSTVRSQWHDYGHDDDHEDDYDNDDDHDHDHDHEDDHDHDHDDD